MQWNQDTFQFLSNLIQELTLNQNGSYFPKSLNCSILWAFWIGHCDCKKTHLGRFVVIGHPMGRVRFSGHPHSLNYFQNTDEWWDLNQLRIPRCVKFNVHQPIVEVHGFCDASQRAFRNLRIHSRQARYQRPSLQVTVFKISRRTAQNRLATAIRIIGRLTISALNQQG